MRKIDRELKEKLFTLISSMGYELVGCELIPQGRLAIFRIYIDNPPGGVTVDNCAEVSYQVSALFDVLAPVQGKYNLEVSSPGIDRPLFEIEQYKKYIGNLVKVRMQVGFGHKRQYKGMLQRVEGENIYLLVDDGSEQEVMLPFSQIERANLIEYRKTDRKQKTDS